MISAESTEELLVDMGVRDGEEGSAGEHGGRQGLWCSALILTLRNMERIPVAFVWQEKVAMQSSVVAAYAGHT